MKQDLSDPVIFLWCKVPFQCLLGCPLDAFCRCAFVDGSCSPSCLIAGLPVCREMHFFVVSIIIIKPLSGLQHSRPCWLGPDAVQPLLHMHR